MFETSTDILNWAISLSVLAVAFFICYGLYLLITTLRKGMKIIKLAENIVHKAENLLDLIKNKISSSASYLYMVTELIKKVSKIVKNKKTENQEDNDEEEEFEYEVKPKKKGRKKTRI